MRNTQKIILASTNRHKLEEFRFIFKSYPGVEVMEASDFLRNASKIELAETHDTFLENALAKARLVNWGSHYPAIADDSGLEVDALNGEPGVHSRRYSIAKAGQSQSEANIQKLLDALKGRPSPERKARFRTVVALCMEGLDLHAEGVLEGTIAEAPTGAGGFGYDSVFIPDGMQKTLAELTEAQKNEMSHRARAIHRLMDQVREHGLLFVKP